MGKKLKYRKTIERQPGVLSRNPNSRVECRHGKKGEKGYVLLREAFFCEGELVACPR